MSTTPSFNHPSASLSAASAAVPSSMHYMMMGSNPSTQVSPGTGQLSKLVSMNEQAWLKVGTLSESMGDTERAIYAYEAAARHNPYNSSILQRLGQAYLQQEKYLQS
jgi:hypothetical protein